MSITDILIVALVGMLVVFAVLVILMLCINIMAAIFKKFDNKTPVAATGENPIAPKKSTPAPGSCGDLHLENISEKDAAMIMAITADKLKTPLNELRFISIKEVEEK